MNKLIILLIPILLLCGCDNRKCIESHQEDDTCVWYQYIKVGQVTRMIPHYYSCKVTVCDRYEEKEEQ